VLPQLPTTRQVRNTELLAIRFFIVLSSGCGITQRSTQRKAKSLYPPLEVDVWNSVGGAVESSKQF